MTDRYVKVKGSPGLVRDPVTNAILNVDQSVLMKQRHRNAVRQKETLLDDKINRLERDLSEIKDLLKKLVS
jgi:hypothetical protein